MKIIKGNIVDIVNRNIYPASITIESEYIIKIKKLDRLQKNYLVPGLIDSHVHIESSLLTPASFAVAAVKEGTIAAIADPH